MMNRANFFPFLFFSFLKICVSLHAFQTVTKAWVILWTEGGWETSLFQKIKERQKAKKRRYMKSSCRWTTIHFHFEVPRTVVKCDCMWQSPSLPVYHDGYTLPPWQCYSTCTRMHTLRQAHAETNLWIQRHAEVHFKKLQDRRRETVTFEGHGFSAALWAKAAKGILQFFAWDNLVY